MRQRSNLIILFGIAFFIVGGAIVYLVLNDDDDSSSRASSTEGVAQVSVLVANGDIAPNTLGSEVIEQGLLTTEQVDSGSAPSGALQSAGSLENQIFAVGVAEGEIITSAQTTTRSLTNIQVPEGFDGVAVTVDFTNGGAGYVAPGDTVNIYGLYGSPTEGGDAGLTTVGGGGDLLIPRTELALTNIRVLGVSDQAPTAAQQQAATEGAEATQGATEGPLTYFFALRPADVERLVQLDQFAGLYVSLTADDAPAAGDTPGVSGDNVNGPVSAASAAPQS